MSKKNSNLNAGGAGKAGGSADGGGTTETLQNPGGASSKQNGTNGGRRNGENEKKSRSDMGGADKGTSGKRDKGVQSGASKRWAPWLGFWAVLLLAIAWVGIHAYLVDAVTVRLCNYFDQNLPPEKRMPVFLSEIAFDGYVWNRHAEHLGRDGDWRLRFTDFDNAPYGREVHWNSAFAWYLRGLGEIHFALTKDEPGATLQKSIYRMSIWANPILLVVALLIFAPLTAIRFGPLSGTVIAIGMVSVPTFYEGFMPAYPDHHGLISFALLGMLFGIAWAGAGWVRGKNSAAFILPLDMKQARHGMIFSAICGAAGLWFSALSTSIVLGTLGFAALVSTLLFLKVGRKAGLEFHPELWRTWALWGSGMALGFYALEYFPNHLSMRLEVNHPLYALAFLAGGWAIYEIARWYSAEKRVSFPWQRLLLCAAAGAILPLLILLGGPSVYIPHDPFMGRLWKNIAELLPLMFRIQTGGLTWQIAIGWFPLLLLAGIVLQFVKGLDWGTKAVIAFMGLPIVLLTLLQFYQVRWGLLVGPLYIALAAILIPVVWNLLAYDRVSSIITAFLLACFGYLFIHPALRNCFGSTIVQYRAQDGQIPLSPGQGLALLHRQMARAIADSAQGREVVLLSSPNSSCILGALGNFKTLGTLYWENVDGLKNAARLLNAQSDREARELFDKHGITHISMMTWENFIEPYFHILYPNAATEVLAPGEQRRTPVNSFGIRALFQKTIPQFTRPIVFPHNQITKYLNQTVLMLEYQPQQTVEEAKYYLARYALRVEDDPVQGEIGLRDALESPSVGVSAAGDLANLYVAQKRDTDAIRMFERVLQSGTADQIKNTSLSVLETAMATRNSNAGARIAQMVLERPDSTSDALLSAAWFWAAYPEAEARDGARAGQALERVKEQELENPEQLPVVRAAAAAAAGDYQRAKEFASQAAASPFPLIANMGREMLAAFSMQQPWGIRPARN